MIIDSIKNTDKYNNLSDNIKIGLGFLKKTDFNKLKDDKHIISEDIYVNIQTYTTKIDADYEAHRNYIDIQYIIKGEELIGVTEYKNCSTTIPYNSGNDIEFLSGDGEFYKLSEGYFMILYPNDAHKPSISINKSNPTEVRKAVVKVRI